MLLRIEMGFCGTAKQRVGGRESSAIVRKKMGNSMEEERSTYCSGARSAITAV